MVAQRPLAEAARSTAGAALDLRKITPAAAPAAIVSTAASRRPRSSIHHTAARRRIGTTQVQWKDGRLAREIPLATAAGATGAAIGNTANSTAQGTSHQRAFFNSSRDTAIRAAIAGTSGST